MAADTTVDRDREAAVELARTGRMEEARDRLVGLRARHPSDVRVLADLLVVLGWMNADAEVTAAVAGSEPRTLPSYALEVVARATRSTGDPAGAATLYAGIVSAEPDRRESWLGLALSLVESGRPADGLEALRSLLQLDDTGHDAAVAAGHVYRALGDPLEAALWYQRALERSPRDAEAYRGRTLALAEMGASQRAAEQLRLRPDLFSPAEQQQLEGDVAASAVRGINLPAVRPDEPYRRADEALAILDERVASVPDDLAYHQHRARFDRLIALSARGRSNEVVAEVERLERDGVELPPFVLATAGDAWLQIRQPRQAEAYFRRDLEQRPGHVDSRIGLFYALIEGERYGEALAQIDSLVAEQPAWRWAPGLREPRENADRVHAEATAHMGRAFAGRLAEAQQGVEGMVDRAPLNAALRAELSSIYRYRGHATRALEQAELGLALDSVSLSLRVARAAALLELREWREAEREVDALRTLHPDNTHVRRLATGHDLERGWALHVDGEKGSGTGAVVGTDDARVDATLLSPRSAAGVRGMVRARRSDGEFEAGKAVHERVEAGVQVDRRSGWLSLAAGTDRHGDAPGVSAELGVRHGDRLMASVDLETRSSRVPLQARLAGVDGWSSSATGRMTWHEGRNAGLELTRTRMDDGNERLSAHASFEQRLATTPHVKLTGMLELYASRNSLDGAPYYNPSRDFAPLGGLAAEWTTWRRYDRSFSQRFAVSGGGYWQDGFGMRPTAIASYQHIWNVSPGLALRYGVSAWSRAFDGNRERRAAFTASVDWRVR